MVFANCFARICNGQLAYAGYGSSYPNLRNLYRDILSYPDLPRVLFQMGGEGWKTLTVQDVTRLALVFKYFRQFMGQALRLLRRFRVLGGSTITIITPMPQARTCGSGMHIADALVWLRFLRTLRTAVRCAHGAPLSACADSRMVCAHTVAEWYVHSGVDSGSTIPICRVRR